MRTVNYYPARPLGGLETSYLEGYVPYVGTFLRCLYEKPRGMANDFSFDVINPLK